MNLAILKPHIRPSKLDKFGQASIQIRIALGNERVEISTGKSIDPDFWDNKTGQAIGQTSEARALNIQVARIIKDLEKLCLEADLNNKVLTASALKSAFKGERATIHGRSLMGVLDEFISNCELQRRSPANRSMEGFASGTIAHFKTTRSKVQAYLIFKSGKDDIRLKDIDGYFLHDFDLYLRTHYANRNGNNTAVKTVKRLLGMTERYHHEFGVPNIRKTYEKTFRVVRKDHLTWDELEKLDAQPMPSKRLERARDVFVFACYTALGYAELAALSEKHLGRTSSGRIFITRMVRRKTGEALTTPLLTRPNRIIAKYRNDPKCIAEGKLLPVLSNQKYNDCLKEIAAICGIGKELTSHCARRTFAVTVAGEHGLSLEVIARWLSHASTKTTQQYYYQVNEKMLEQASEELESQISRRYYRPEDLFGATGDI
jgi:integrase